MAGDIRVGVGCGVYLCVCVCGGGGSVMCLFLLGPNLSTLV